MRSSQLILSALLSLLLIACSSGSNNVDGNDIDSDGVENSLDNCPAVYNADQFAVVGNATLLGDICDDEDSDSIVDALDNCPLASNPEQNDSDGNGLGDACDACKPTALVADLWQGPGSSFPDSLTVLDSKLYFKANDGLHGEELWVYDPASPVTGARLVTDILPGSGASTPSGLAALNGILYFEADDGSSGDELWQYDPTGLSSMAQLATDTTPGPASTGAQFLVELNGKVYFTGNNGSVWEYDPAFPANGASMLAESGFYRPRDLKVLGAKLYLYRRTFEPTKRELWVFDPANPAIDITLDQIIVPSTSANDISGLTVFNNKLYVGASDGISGEELWAYDPANPEDAFVLVSDIFPGKSDGRPDYLTALADKLYFSANDGVHGVELMVHDPANPTASSAFESTFWSSSKLHLLK